MVTVLFFASLRERVGTSREMVALESPHATVSMLVEALRKREGAWAEAFPPGGAWRVAVNQRMADLATPLRGGDEVAFFPPVTGG
jgi:molybdopterin synthase sulfur carrier subunit